MAFEIPTLPALVQRANNDLEQGASSVLRRSDMRALARVQSGTAYGLYGFMSYVAQQILPDTCGEEMLYRWAAMKSVPRKEPAAASGFIRVNGTLGVIVDADVMWQYGDGTQYAVSADTVLTGPDTLVPVQAVIAGQSGNASAAMPLQAVSPVIGMLDQALVDVDGLSGGTDIEDLEVWRSRVLRSFRITPHGGDADDYVTWALEVPGVTRAWCVRSYLGPGTVGVFFVRDGDDDIIPSAGEVADVRSHIESKQPVTVELYVMAPQTLAVSYEIQLEPDTTLMRARVEQSLRALHTGESDLGTRMYLSHMREAISTTQGELDHQLLSPVADIVPASNELPVFGSVVWV